jgi:tetratricopeptide (TPR) repeat protein
VWRIAAWSLAAAAALTVAGFGIWYGASPPIPNVHLHDGTDPELIEAVSQARWAIRRSPWSDQPRGHMAMLLYVHRLNAEAAVFYTQAEHLNPAEPRWPYLHSFVVADDPPAALELLRRAARLSAERPGSPDAARLKLADVCLEQEQFDEAEREYRQLLAADPDHARAHLGLARLAVLRNQPEKALPHLKACASNPTTRKAAATLLAEVHQRRGDTGAAEQATREASKLPPKDIPWFDPWLDEARTLHKGKAGRLYRLTELMEQGRTQEAAAWARKMIEDYPDMKYAEIARGRLNEGRWDEAEEAARQAVAASPEFPDGYFYLGRALLAKRRFAEAAENFRRVTELRPTNSLAYAEWGRCAAGLGDRAEAIRRLQLAVLYSPIEADAHRDLGALLEEAGDRDGALEHLRQAVQLNDKDQQARELLDKLQAGAKPSKPKTKP